MENNEFPPIMIMAHVITSSDNLENLNFVPDEIFQFERKWKMRGIVTACLPDYEDWYEVLHNDGFLGCYHVTELKLEEHNSDDDEEDDFYTIPPTPSKQKSKLVTF